MGSVMETDPPLNLAIVAAASRRSHAADNSTKIPLKKMKLKLCNPPTDGLKVLLAKQKQTAPCPLALKGQPTRASELSVNKGPSRANTPTRFRSQETSLRAYQTKMVRHPVVTNKGPTVPSSLTSNRSSNISTGSESPTLTSPKTRTGLCPLPTKEEDPKVKRNGLHPFLLKPQTERNAPLWGCVPFLPKRAQG